METRRPCIDSSQSRLWYGPNAWRQERQGIILASLFSDNASWPPMCERCVRWPITAPALINYELNERKARVRGQ